MVWPKGRKFSPEHCQKISVAGKGKKHTLESRQRISEAAKGRKGYWLGKKLSPEHRRKLSEALRGEKNPNWKGGRTIRFDGRVLLLCPDHPNADFNGYVPRSRLVMEEHLGRPLTDEEVVHHKGAKDDDRIEMLKLFPSNSAHRKYETQSKEREGGTGRFA